MAQSHSWVTSFFDIVLSQTFANQLKKAFFIQKTIIMAPVSTVIMILLLLLL